MTWREEETINKRERSNISNTTSRRYSIKIWKDEELL